MITYYNGINRVEEKESFLYFGLNEYFQYRLDPNNILLTSAHGGWIILSNQEYETLKKDKLRQEPGLFKKLEEVGIALTSRSVKNVCTDLRVKYDFLSDYPSFHVISPTETCDLKCIYCHPGSTPGREVMEETTARKVLDFIFSIPTRRSIYIQVTGGEPLTKWDFVKFLYSEAKKRSELSNVKFRFLLSTNLTLMTDKIAQELSQMQANICTSLDGPKELHDKHRPYVNGSGSYDTVAYWIRRLRENFKIKAGALPVITRFSLACGPEPIIDEYLRLDQSAISLKPFRCTGRALLNLKRLEMTPEDFYAFWERGVEYCLSLNKRGVRVMETNAMYFIKNIFSPLGRNSMCHRRPCGAGITMLAYRWDGSICACDAARDLNFLDLGDVDRDNYNTIKSKTLPLLGTSADTIPICSSCPFMAYCNTCRIDTWSRENDIYPKIPRSFDCKWHKRAIEFLFKKLLDKEDAQILQSWAKP